MQRIGRYEILDELGRGGFGRVYRANDPLMKCEVAVKVMSNSDDPEMLARFRDEAAAARKLRHESIVTIYDVGEENGVPYIVMEYLQGMDLQRMRDANVPLSLVEKVRILSQVAAGLQVAHENGVLHRDVKPGNIMVLKDGSVKIMDFGIARLTREDATRRTRTGMVVGTLQYIPPEQFEQHPTDNLADLWAYGVIAYQLFSGRNPFDATDTVQVIYNITSLPIPDLRRLNPELPDDLCQIVTKLLKRDRTQRYQTFEDVRIDLNPVLERLEGLEAQRLVEDARVVAARGDLHGANQIVRQVLEKHPSNTQAKAIRDQVVSQLRATETTRQVDELLNRGDQAFAKGSYEEAYNTYKQAVTLNSGSSTARLRMERATQMLERKRRIWSELSDARARLSAGAADQAQQILAGVLADDPENVEARSLMVEVEKEVMRSGASARAEAILMARQLMSQRQYSQALLTLSTCAQTVGTHPELLQALEEVRRAEKANADQERLEAGIAKANEFIQRGAFADAYHVLSHLCADFPNNPDLAAMMNYAREEEARKRRRSSDSMPALRPATTPLPSGGAPASSQSAAPAIPRPDRNSVIVRALQLSSEKERAGQVPEAAHILEVALSRFPDADELVQELRRLLAPKPPAPEWAPGVAPVVRPAPVAKPPQPPPAPSPAPLPPRAQPSRRSLWVGVSAVGVAAAVLVVWQAAKPGPEKAPVVVQPETKKAETKPTAMEEVRKPALETVAPKNDAGNTPVKHEAKNVDQRTGPSLASLLPTEVKFQYRKSQPLSSRTLKIDRTPLRAVVRGSGFWLMASTAAGGVVLELKSAVASLMAGEYHQKVDINSNEERATLDVVLTVSEESPAKTEAPPQVAPPPKQLPATQPDNAAAQTPAGKRVYNGPLRGTVTWSGTLAPGAKLSLNEAGLVAGSGQLTGGIPPIDVDVDLTPTGLEFHAYPTGSATRVTITNTTPAPVNYIRIGWRKKD